MKLNIHVSLINGCWTKSVGEFTDERFYKTYTVPCTPEVASDSALLNTYALGVMLEHNWLKRDWDKEGNLCRFFAGSEDPAAPNVLVAKCRYELEITNA